MLATLDGSGCGSETGVWDRKRDILKTMRPAAGDARGILCVIHLDWIYILTWTYIDDDSSENCEARERGDEVSRSIRLMSRV